MNGIKLGTLVFIVINIFINKVIGFRLNDEDLKKVIVLMQQQLLHGQSKTQGTRSRHFDDDLLDNDRNLVISDNLYDITRTNTEDNKENPMTILIFKAKYKPKESKEDTIVKNLLKEILNEKLINNKYNVNLKPNFKTNEFSNEVKDLKKFSKLYLILNSSNNRNVLNGNDLNDIGRLLSKLLSTKASKNNENKKRYYKGFAVKDDESSSRRRRDSDESEADDYRPKRSRIKNNGVVGGRTFAPSMGKKRHVYESE
ncbi:PREDICTED: coiled-coil domain-containing protein 94 homolog [Papilio xuthus]|uniref:Coiled-coil domain-containing protein 94 homolog n=1 Tax=Papilio xuthus TaxID=66420 RepID=A0AAJ7EG46_PAPXU|nr:PREDICTED: coiled-coil domain-containing protein 94 homolog [Papilio xuthus]